jgi:hypothetical protein
LTQQFTGKSGDDLKAFRNEVQAVADSFGADFRETLIATNALSQQFGISANEALQLVKDGFLSGADANGEFLDTLKEYPAYFKEAGISADQFVAIVFPVLFFCTHILFDCFLKKQTKWVSFRTKALTQLRRQICVCVK